MSEQAVGKTFYKKATGFTLRFRDSNNAADKPMTAMIKAIMVNCSMLSPIGLSESLGRLLGGSVGVKVVVGFGVDGGVGLGVEVEVESIVIVWVLLQPLTSPWNVYTLNGAPGTGMVSLCSV